MKRLFMTLGWIVVQSVYSVGSIRHDEKDRVETIKGRFSVRIPASPPPSVVHEAEEMWDLIMQGRASVDSIESERPDVVILPAKPKRPKKNPTRRKLAGPSHDIPVKKPKSQQTTSVDTFKLWQRVVLSRRPSSSLDAILIKEQHYATQSPIDVRYLITLQYGVIDAQDREDVIKKIMMPLVEYLKWGKDTLWMAVDYMDRYLSQVSLSNDGNAFDELDLIAFTSVYMASKVNEDRHYRLSSLVKMFEYIHIRDVIYVEKQMLSLLHSYLSPSTPHAVITEIIQDSLFPQEPPSAPLYQAVMIVFQPVLDKIMLDVSFHLYPNSMIVSAWYFLQSMESYSDSDIIETISYLMGYDENAKELLLACIEHLEQMLYNESSLLAENATDDFDIQSNTSTEVNVHEEGGPVR